MSTIVPPMQFRLGAAGNFPVVAVLFKEICLKFGVPGQEIIRGVRIPLLLPARQDTDSTGFLYRHEFLLYSSGDILREADGSAKFDTMSIVEIVLLSLDLCSRFLF